MPYIIVKSKKGPLSGYRVRKLMREPTGKFKYFSKKPLPLKRAKKQVIALQIANRRAPIQKVGAYNK